MKRTLGNRRSGAITGMGGIVLVLPLTAVLVMMVSIPAGCSRQMEKSQVDAMSVALAQHEMERWADDRWERWGENHTGSSNAESNATPRVDQALVADFHTQLMAILVTPPDPDSSAPYAISNAAVRLAEYDALGQRLGAVIVAADQKELDAAGNVLEGMWDLLWLDFIHIPLAMKQDNSRDVFWQQLHSTVLARVEDAYSAFESQKPAE